MLKYDSGRRTCVSSARASCQPDFLLGSCGRFIMNWTVSRRVALKTFALTAYLPIGARIIIPCNATASPSLDSFIAMSVKLTGQASLDRDMGKSILGAFIETGHGEDIAELIADATPEQSQLTIANAVVAAWYSGMSPIASATQVMGFNEALVWTALSYTKPWGSCGGETGYWSDAPSDGEQ